MKDQHESLEGPRSRKRYRLCQSYELQNYRCFPSNIVLLTTSKSFSSCYACQSDSHVVQSTVNMMMGTLIALLRTFRHFLDFSTRCHPAEIMSSTVMLAWQ